ncbi:MAG: hypothetical protein ACXVXN_01070 [Mycobacteriaceae bacterium]
MSTAEPPGGEQDRDATEIDASFAAIVAGWGEDEPRWPEDEAPHADPEPLKQTTRRSTSDSSADVDDEGWPEDEGHYEPPEPPPFPRPRAPTLGAMILLGIGLVLLFIPAVIGLTDIVGLPLGLLAVASGLLWLFLLLRTGPPLDSGFDDGSRL